MDEFTVTLFSTGSINVFPGNTLSHFTNRLSERLQLDGDWVVALAEISYPSSIKTVTDYTNFGFIHPDKGLIRYAQRVKHGIYKSVEDVALRMASIINVQRSVNEDTAVQIGIDPETQIMTFKMSSHSSIIFYNDEIPNILGIENKVISTDDDELTTGKYPVDLFAGKHYLFVYINVIEHQHVSDTKAPLLRVITIKNRVKDGRLDCPEPIYYEAFQDLQYKKLLVNSISSISVELRTETGQYVPFLGVGTVALTLKFKKV